MKDPFTYWYVLRDGIAIITINISSILEITDILAKTGTAQSLFLYIHGALWAQANKLNRRNSMILVSWVWKKPGDLRASIFMSALRPNSKIQIQKVT